MKYLIPIIFFTVLISILIAANFYLSKRFAYFFNIESVKTIKYVIGAAMLIMFFGMMPLTNTVSSVGSVVYQISAITMGILLYLLMSTLFFDGLNLMFKFKPQLHGILSISSTLIIIVYGLVNANNTQIKRITIPVEGLQKNTKIVQLTDIHIGHFRGKDFLQKIVTLTQAEKPDFVVITGDLFDGKINLKQEVLNPLKQLNVPCYFVDGNHDEYTGVTEVEALVRNTGVKVLKNEIAYFKDIQIIGLNHMSADSNSRNIHAHSAETIQETLLQLPIKKDNPSIILHHSPEGVKYANQAGVDLYLAGHTHAGQLFPISIIAKWMFPYNKGLYDYKGTKMYVSQGIGTFGPPMRVGTNSEIAVITLSQAN